MYCRGLAELQINGGGDSLIHYFVPFNPVLLYNNNRMSDSDSDDAQRKDAARRADALNRLKGSPPQSTAGIDDADDSKEDEAVRLMKQLEQKLLQVSKKSSTFHHPRNPRRPRASKEESEPPKKRAEFTIDDVPLSIQQSPLFLFAKLVAGEIAQLEFKEMFNMTNLAKEEEGVTMLSISNILLRGITKAGSFMSRSLQQGGLRDITANQLIEDPTHPLYEAFVDLVSYHIRSSLSIRPRGPESVKSMDKMDQKRDSAVLNFLMAIRSYRRRFDV